MVGQQPTGQGLGAMSERPIQIFVSYARDDDARPPPGAPGTMGFVEYLQTFMDHKFKTTSPQRPQFWRDDDNLYRGEQSWPVIEKALNESSLLLVVLSKNWIGSDYCKRELAHFVRRFQERGESFDERIIIAAKNHVEREGRPSGLQHQDGFKFYALSDRVRIPEVEFFAFGKPLEDRRYWATFDELCDFILRRVRQLNSRYAPMAETSVGGRTVYVAKPASDMLDHYIGVVKELTSRGYKVVPKRDEDISPNGSTSASIENLLASAQDSVHLLGESGRGDDESIVKLQLARAANRVGLGSNHKFRRLIWAPKRFLIDAVGEGKVVERDPFDVLKSFGTQLPTDKIFGEDVATFVQSVLPLLPPLEPTHLPDRSASDDIDGATSSIAAGVPNFKIFILHAEKDRALARDLRRALRQFNIEGVLPAIQGDEVQCKAFDKESIRICDSIALCWGSSSEVWTLAQARQFSNWGAFGRSQRWSRLSVVLGPPPGEIKKEFLEDGPPGGIDAVVDLEDGATISPEALRKLVPTDWTTTP
jgi:TIR domain